MLPKFTAFTAFTAFSPTVKNRYEILFFNKDALCAMMSSIKKNTNSSTSSLIVTSQQNISNNNLNVNNTSSSELKSKINKLSEEDIDSIDNIIQNTNIKGCKIDFKNDDIINYYNILKDCSYLRLYFKYTNDESLGERFKKNGKKDFNYIKKYNISILKTIIDYLKGIGKGESNKEIENNYKKLDDDIEKQIDNILNTRISSEEEHYKKIKEVLKIIKDETGGYINYCIILDIKKSKLMSINSITKKTNSNNKTFNNKTFNNKTFQNGGVFLYISNLITYYRALLSHKYVPKNAWSCLQKGKKPNNHCTNNRLRNHRTVVNYSKIR